MRFDKRMLAVIAGAVVLQAAASQAQPGVSMAVTSQQSGTVGYACEPFTCTPHKFQVGGGDVVLVETFGLADNPYILFAGAPAPGCTPLSWVLGELAMTSPVFIIDVGIVDATGLPNQCGLDRMARKLTIPADVPSGAQLVLQTAAWPAESDLPSFSRAVMLITP